MQADYSVLNNVSAIPIVLHCNRDPAAVDNATAGAGELEVGGGGILFGGVSDLLTHTTDAESQSTFTGCLSALQSALVHVEAGAHASPIIRDTLVLGLEVEEVEHWK